MRSKEFRTQIWQNKMRRRTRRRTATSSYGHRPHGSLAGSAGQGRRCRLGRRHALLHQPLQRGELGLIRMVASSNVLKCFYRFFSRVLAWERRCHSGSAAALHTFGSHRFDRSKFYPLKKQCAKSQRANAALNT